MKVRINDNTISSVFACVYPTLNDTGMGIVSVYLFQHIQSAKVIGGKNVYSGVKAECCG